MGGEGGERSEPGEGLMLHRHVHYAVDKDTGRHDHFRIELAEFDDTAHLHDREIRRHRHRRIEITCRFAVGQIAPTVAAIGGEHCDVALQRFFQNIDAAVALVVLLAVGKPCPDRYGRVETAEPGSGAAHALADYALRHQLQFDAAGGIELLEHHRAGAAREGADDPAHPTGREQGGEPPPPGPGIVGDDGQIARPLLDDRLAQRIRQSGAAKPGAQDRRAIGDAADGFGEALDAFVDHQNATASPPFSASIARASSGVAISSDRFSMIDLTQLTWSALLSASLPRPIHSESSSPTRTLPPMIAPIDTSGNWWRPAASTHH